MGVPNSAGGAAEDNTSASGLPNSAGGTAEAASAQQLGVPNSTGGAAEDNTSASGFPNPAGGTAEAAADANIDRLAKLLQPQPQDVHGEMLLQQPQQQDQILDAQQDAVHSEAALLQQEQAGHQQSITLFQQQQHQIATQDTSRREEQHLKVSCQRNQRNQRIVQQRSIARAEEHMSESVPIDGGIKKKKAVVDQQEKLRICFSDYSERHGLMNTTENIENNVKFYAGREIVLMRFLAYIEKYEPQADSKSIVPKTLEEYRGREEQLLLDISGWEEGWEATLRVPNPAGGAAAVVTEIDALELGVPILAGGEAEDNTSASGSLGFPNLAGREAGGMAENNTSAMGLPNSAGGGMDSTSLAPRRSGRIAKRNNQDMSD